MTTRSARALRWSVLAFQAARGPHIPTCRFVPSCSTYAVQALERHGARRGVWLTSRRLFRCRPWGGWGSDPVPETT